MRLTLHESEKEKGKFRANGGDMLENRITGALANMCIYVSACFNVLHLHLWHLSPDTPHWQKSVYVSFLACCWISKRRWPTTSMNAAQSRAMSSKWSVHVLTLERSVTSGHREGNLVRHLLSVDNSRHSETPDGPTRLDEVKELTHVVLFAANQGKTWRKMSVQAGDWKPYNAQK